MVSFGLLVRCEVRSGKDDEVEGLLRTASGMVRHETSTMAWFGIRFGRGEYGIFDVFSDETGREAHLAGPVAKALREMTPTLFTKPPEITRLNILAAKLPLSVPLEQDTKGLLLTFKAKQGHEAQVEQFLREAQTTVLQEAKTTAWFALRLENGEYGIFDTFPDTGGRFAHMAGHVPRELAKHALTLLGGMPDMDMVGIVAENFRV